MKYAFAVILISIAMIAVVGFVFQSNVTGALYATPREAPHQYVKPYPFTTNDPPQGYPGPIAYYGSLGNPFQNPQLNQGYYDDQRRSLNQYKLYPYGQYPSTPYYVTKGRVVFNPNYVDQNVPQTYRGY